MHTQAIVFEQPERLSVASLQLPELGDEDVLVDVEWSGISTGTERLLWNGRMPSFPGMGYPLVPGYETVGRVAAGGRRAMHRVGQRVFVPGANCFGAVRGMFGGAASRLLVPARRALPLTEPAAGHTGADDVMLALAASAYHAVAGGGRLDKIIAPDLIVGHGVLGRLLARLSVAAGLGPVVVWETDPQRTAGARGYQVVHPDDDPRRDYRAIYDVSGDASLLNELIGRLARGGLIVLAGFYSEPLSFLFPAAFQREVQIRVAAEWERADLLATQLLVESGQLSLDGLITHQEVPACAAHAYRTAFDDTQCLKMVLDWRHAA